MVNKAECLSEYLVFRLGLLKNVFTIYETLPKLWHDLIISPPIYNNVSIIFFPKKVFVLS